MWGAMLRLCILWFICLSIPFAAQAKLYKIIHEDGSITFTDTPPTLGAKEHILGKNINAIENPAFNVEKLNLIIPYTEENGTMTVKGSVNGIAMQFIVDTGATLLAIPPTIAQQAGLLSIESQPVTAQTANGSINVSKVTIKTVTVAKVKASQIEATIQTISPTNNRLGLLGMSFFNRYKMTIDHEKKEIQLVPK